MRGLTRGTGDKLGFPKSVHCAVRGAEKAREKKEIFSRVRKDRKE